MWSHYSNSHTGYCIGFKTKSFILNDIYRFGQGNVVRYEQEFPIILPTEDYFAQATTILYTKAKPWEYEQEYRLIKTGSANTVVSFTSDEVEEIIIGCSTNDSDTKSILNICKCNLRNIPVFKAKQKRLDFNLTFDRII